MCVQLDDGAVFLCVFFDHYPVGFGSASEPKRLRNSEEHVIP